MKSSFESVLLCLLLAGASAWAQDQAPGQTPNPAPAPQTPAPSPPATLPQPEVSSPINTGNGFSIEPIYWYTRGGIPVLREGTTNIQVNPGNLDYTSRPEPSIGARISIPLSKNGTLRGSYFQTKSNGLTTAPEDLNLFGLSIPKGDLLATNYRIEAFKLSYDYLTYFWKRGNSELRLKTLWEIQRISMSNEIGDFVRDTSGTIIDVVPATGAKTIFSPTFGLGLEHTLSRHFRWEARASGMALPHRAVLGDMDAAVAFRVGHFELLAGGRFLHFKTTPQSTHYNIGNLYGPYAGLRFYWKKQ